VVPERGEMCGKDDMVMAKTWQRDDTNSAAQKKAGFENKSVERI
jgi:hypothetical protein